MFANSASMVDTWSMENYSDKDAFERAGYARLGIANAALVSTTHLQRQENQRVKQRAAAKEASSQELSLENIAEDPVDEPGYSQSWQAQANCISENPEVFFPGPEGRAGRNRHEIARAKAICASCQVQKACLQFALQHKEEHGIWGGLTSRERARLARRRSRTSQQNDSV